MSITAVTGTDYWITPTTTETSSETGTNSLDFNAFLELIATELSNQDPLDPVGSTEYVSQMAQISSMQQLENMSAYMASYQALSLLDKCVIYQTTDSSGQTVTASGTVTSVINSGGTTYLNVNGTLVSHDSIVEVYTSE